jgi:hypothetical protein
MFFISFYPSSLEPANEKGKIKLRRPGAGFKAAPSQTGDLIEGGSRRGEIVKKAENGLPLPSRA